MAYRNKRTGETISNEQFNSRFGMPQPEKPSISREELALQTEQAKIKEAEAKKYLEMPGWKQVLPPWLTGAERTPFHEEFGKLGLKGLGQAAKTALFEYPTRWAKTVIEAPETLIRGGKKPVWTEKLTSKIPYMKDLPSFQEAGGKVGRDIVSEAIGEKEAPKIPFTDIDIPWQARAVLPMAEFLGATWEIVNLGKGILAVGKGLKNKWATIRQNKQLAKSLKALTFDPNDLSKREYEDMVKWGKVTPKGKGKPAQIILDDDQMKWVEKYSDLLQSKDPIKNGTNVANRITEMDSSIGTYLKDTKQIYARERLRKLLMDKIEPITDILVPSEKTLTKVKTQLVNSIVDDVADNSLYGLWGSRKHFDRTIGVKLKAFSGIPTLKKEIARGVRDGVQEFIVTEIGDDVYKTTMKDMSELINVEEILLTKAGVEKGKNAVSVWLGKHSLIRKLMPWFGGAAFGWWGYRVLGR